MVEHNHSMVVKLLETPRQELPSSRKQERRTCKGEEGLHYHAMFVFNHIMIVYAHMYSSSSAPLLFTSEISLPNKLRSSLYLNPSPCLLSTVGLCWFMLVGSDVELDNVKNLNVKND